MSSVRVALAVACCAAPLLIDAQTCPAGVPVAFVNVSVLTMDSAVLLRGRTVLTRDGKIASIDARRLPPETCRITGAGRVLMPGLIDMHVHTSEREMPLFLANGVTFIREMNGSPELLALRDRIRRGEVVGPRMLVASPLLVGQEVRYRHRLITSADDATAAAREAKAAGYDYLKIYDGLTRAEYDALVAAGRALNIPLDGHIPADVGLEAALDAGQYLQHMDKIAFALAGHSNDTAQLLGKARALFAGRRAWVTPTLASLLALDEANTTAYAEWLSRPEMQYADSGSMAWWASLTGTRVRASRSLYYQFETSLLKLLRTTDTRFLLGTDAANPLMVAGFSVHDELETLVRDGGFSGWEALRSATRNVGEFLGDPLIGHVVVGAPADLLLVDGDPLANLRVLRTPVGVMANGRWLARAQLDSMLAGARQR